MRLMSEFHSNGEQPDVLFWVGCAGSFDARAQRVTQAFVKILQHVGVSFAILGNEETCTGDPARRAGNEFVFQMLALQNIETLNMYNVKKIVTACPHCFNTLKNEYPELGGTYDVVHHSQFLEDLINSDRLTVSDLNKVEKIAYHDSCFLGRVNGEYDAPRNILKGLKSDIADLKRSKQNGLCCGAGGAQMFKEDEQGDKRINEERVEELLDTGAATIVANCPFCLTMLGDGLKAKEKQDDVMVYDLSEMIVKKMRL